MTIGETYAWMTDQLKSVYDEREAASIADLVLESRFGLRRIDRIIRKTEMLPSGDEVRLQGDLGALLQNVPVQYVLGEAWFDGLLFRVNDHVLIPRPETEELVYWMVDDIKARADAPRDRDKFRTEVAVLDVGTGSGCIPIALKKRIPRAAVHALDVSPQAVALARENAGRLEADIHFFLLDFLDETTWDSLPEFNLIVSNPPYIAGAESAAMHARVLGHEPHLALFVPDNDPLLFYRKIARFSGSHLYAGGVLYLEINEALGYETTHLLEQEGFTQITLRKDLQGKDRMIRATR